MKTREQVVQQVLNTQIRLLAKLWLRKPYVVDQQLLEQSCAGKPRQCGKTLVYTHWVNSINDHQQKHIGNLQNRLNHWRQYLKNYDEVVVKLPLRRLKKSESYSYGNLHFCHYP